MGHAILAVGAIENERGGFGAMRVSLPLAVALAAVLTRPGWAQDHVNYGTAVKLSPVYYLPVLAAQERGIFQKHGLAVDWVPARNGPDFIRDLAASAVQIGSSNGGTDIPAIDQGAPAVIVASLQPSEGFAVWVSTDGKIKTVQDLKGAKIGVSRLGGAEHGYARMAAGQLGLQDINFVSSGGIEESLAMLRTGGIDGVVLTPNQMIDLELQGKVKRLVEIEDYKPKPWISYTITASKDFVAKSPDVAKRVVASIFEANRFVMSDAGRGWAIAKMKEENHYSDAASAAVYRLLALNTDGTIDPKAVENVVTFMVKYDLLKQGAENSVDRLFTNALVR
jgi:NitT/TauT family transport system substrate-binding protein